MHDESGDAQRGGWQPPEYVSPWIPASGPEDRDAGRGPGTGEPPSGQDNDRDTLPFGTGPADSVSPAATASPGTARPAATAGTRGAGTAPRHRRRGPVSGG